MQGKLSTLKTVLSVVAAAASLGAGSAWACGACVNPPGGASYVKQKAERVLFGYDPVTKDSLVWVEVQYNGPPGAFGWVIPMPKVPKVGVGSTYLFDRLDQAVAPRMETTVTADTENCRSYSSSSSGSLGCGASANDSSAKATGAYNYEAADASSDAGGGHVTVLEQAQVGPYVYDIIQSDKADAMLAWLNDNGFATPPAALPILQSHVTKGDVFVAFKLQAGEGLDAIRPVTFRMQDADPCVPLRLTSVAAEDDMTVVVYLAGPGRAIPKNQLHVQVNPLRLTWESGGDNYPQLLAAAMDEAQGRAFATEFAGPTKLLSVAPVLAQTAKGENIISSVQFARPVAENSAYGSGALIDATHLDASPFANVATLGDLATALHKADLPLTDDLAANLTEDTTAATVGLDRLVGCPNLWAQMQATGQVPCKLDAKAAVDGVGIAKDTKVFAESIAQAWQMVQGAKTLTRLQMRISPAEMTRDPLFAFHSTLPDVASVHTATMHNVCSQGDYNADATRLTLTDLDRSYIITNGNAGGAFTMGTPTVKTAQDKRFATLPAAYVVQVLDEVQSAAPAEVAPEQIALIDQAIASAKPGQPTLPNGVSLQKAAVRVVLPDSDKPLNFQKITSNGAADPGGCRSGHRAALPPALALLALTATLVLWRRREMR